MKYLFILMLLLAPYSAWAYEVKIVSMDIVDRPFTNEERNVKDYNEEICAILEISYETAKSDLSLDMSKTVGLKKGASSIRAFLVDGTKKIMLYGEGILPTDVYFKDFGIPYLKAGKVYSLKTEFIDTPSGPLTYPEKVINYGLVKSYVPTAKRLLGISSGYGSRNKRTKQETESPRYQLGINMLIDAANYVDMDAIMALRTEMNNNSSLYLRDKIHSQEALNELFSTKPFEERLRTTRAVKANSMRMGKEALRYGDIKEYEVYSLVHRADRNSAERIYFYFTPLEKALFKMGILGDNHAEPEDYSGRSYYTASRGRYSGTQYTYKVFSIRNDSSNEEIFNLIHEFYLKGSASNQMRLGIGNETMRLKTSVRGDVMKVYICVDGMEDDYDKLVLNELGQRIIALCLAANLNGEHFGIVPVTDSGVPVSNQRGFGPPKYMLSEPQKVYNCFGKGTSVVPSNIKSQVVNMPTRRAHAQAKKDVTQEPSRKSTVRVIRPRPYEVQRPQEEKTNTAMAEQQEQTQSQSTATSGSDKVTFITMVDVKPEFIGGQAAMYKWLEQHMNYPVDAMEAGLQGRVIVEFTVLPNGNIANAKIVRGVDESLDKEALRLVKSMPKWKPGRNGGTNVAVALTTPITFKLGR